MIKYLTVEAEKEFEQFIQKRGNHRTIQNYKDITQKINIHQCDNKLTVGEVYFEFHRRQIENIEHQMQLFGPDNYKRLKACGVGIITRLLEEEGIDVEHYKKKIITHIFNFYKLNKEEHKIILKSMDIEPEETIGLVVIWKFINFKKKWEIKHHFTLKTPFIDVNFTMSTPNQRIY